jgi:hypothetical protein
MGIIVNDKLTMGNGLTANNYYMSVGNGMISTSKHTHLYRNTFDSAITYSERYITTGAFKKWISKDASADESIQYFDITNVIVESNTAPTQTVYTLLYDKVKENLVNYVDDI